MALRITDVPDPYSPHKFRNIIRDIINNFTTLKSSISSASTKVEAEYSEDHAVLSSEKNYTLLIDATSAARAVTLDETLGSATDVFEVEIMRHPDDTGTKTISLEDASAVVIATLTAANVGKLLTGLKARANGTIVTCVKYANPV